MNGTTSINIINVGFIGKNIYRWWTFNGTSSNSWGSFPNFPMPPCLARVKKVRVNLGLVLEWFNLATLAMAMGSPGGGESFPGSAEPVGVPSSIREGWLCAESQIRGRS